MKIKAMVRSFAAMALCVGMGGTSTAAAWLKTGSSASRPFGHVAYCAAAKSDCAKRKAASKLPSISLATLRSINQSVNRAIKPVSDMEQFGTREKWVQAPKAGDCEDYALTKRARLGRLGIPRASLLLAVGRSAGEAHTVLVVRTKDGDFVLNNLTDDVTPIGFSTLGISKIQSPTDGSDWLKVTGTQR